MADLTKPEQKVVRRLRKEYSRLKSLQAVAEKYGVNHAVIQRAIAPVPRLPQNRRDRLRLRLPLIVKKYQRASFADRVMASGVDECKSIIALYRYMDFLEQKKTR